MYDQKLVRAITSPARRRTSSLASEEGREWPPNPLVHQSRDFRPTAGDFGRSSTE